MDSLSDEQLVALTQGGDAQAFDRLAARWESAIYGFLRRALGNREDALDLSQETWVKAYLNIRNLRTGASFKSWLYQIALNLCRDRFRSARVRAATQPFDEEGPDAVRISLERAGPRPTLLVTARETRFHQIGEALASLPDEQRTAILLREYQGFTTEEIGQMQGVPAATVRTRIFYGLKTTRRLLRERGLLNDEVKA